MVTFKQIGSHFPTYGKYMEEAVAPNQPPDIRQRIKIIKHKLIQCVVSYRFANFIKAQSCSNALKQVKTAIYKGLIVEEHLLLILISLG